MRPLLRHKPSRADEKFVLGRVKSDNAALAVAEAHRRIAELERELESLRDRDPITGLVTLLSNLTAET